MRPARLNRILRKFESGMRMPPGKPENLHILPRLLTTESARSSFFLSTDFEKIFTNFSVDYRQNDGEIMLGFFIEHPPGQ
jgi:hypothetical protein